MTGLVVGDTFFFRPDFAGEQIAGVPAAADRELVAFGPEEEPF